MAITTEVETLRPANGVRREHASGAFVAEGDDPQMLWVPTRVQEAQLLGRTAVTVRLTLRPLEGRLCSPCIYVDWGDGFSEAVWKPLSLGEDGVYSATAHSNAGACRRIRLDPSTGPCRFQIAAVSIEAAGAASPAMQRIGPMWRLARRLLRSFSPALQHRVRAAKALIAGSTHTTEALQLRQGAVSAERWRLAYDRAFATAQGVRSPHFAAPPLAPPARDPEAARVIAFYLPQYHPIPENDAWWGAGFTDWANVTKATPQFTGHLQPRLPSDLGYYDLRSPEVLRAQADLARRLGVDAFCFHYYWFAGRRLLERPLDAFASDPAITTPFCLCWANENWTRRWDGDEHDVLIGQRHSAEDDVAVIDDLAQYMRSQRYLRVDGRPLVIIYRPDVLPDARSTVERWRVRAREAHIGELFIACTTAFGFSNYRLYDFDAQIDFPPHAITAGEVTDLAERLNPNFRGRIYDYPAVVSERVAELSIRDDPRRYPGVMPGWDNEPRKPGAGHVFHNADPASFMLWMQAALRCTHRLAPANERLVFVNAWNEWAEGAYLEPDRWCGHGTGQALRAALESDAPRISQSDPALAPPPARAKRSALVIAHVYYTELIEEIAATVRCNVEALDVVVTFPETWTPSSVSALRGALPTAHLLPTPNRGRDVAPFIRSLAWARSRGYEVFCKVHSKRSPHVRGGDEQRRRNLSSLLNAETTRTTLEAFALNPALGLVACAVEQMRLGDPGVLWHNEALLKAVGDQLGFTYNDETTFVAGTMFWGRVSAFEALIENSARLSFEVELGRIDGTLAHALERAMAPIVIASGHQISWLP